MQRLPLVSPLSISALCQSVPQLTATSQHHLQHLAAQRHEDQAALTTVSRQLRSKEEFLIGVLFGSSIFLMLTTFAFSQELINDLFAGPSFLDSALIILSGFAKSRHKQRMTQQQQVGVSSSANNSRSRGGPSSSTGGSRGNNRTRGTSSSSSSSSSTNFSSSSSTCCREHGIGATSFVQLLLPADHELVMVSSGLPATAAQAVDPGGAVVKPSVGLPLGVVDLALKAVAKYCTTSHCSYAVPGPSAAAAASSPVLQLLLELTALLGQEEERDACLDGLQKAWDAVSTAATSKERQAFLSARGALLLQVLWLLAEQCSQELMVEGCWIVRWPSLLTSLCATAEGTNCSVQSIAGKPLFMYGHASVTSMHANIMTCS